MNIDNIPDPKDFPQLYDANKEKKLIVFLGAGIPSLWGCERWERLSSRIIESFFDENMINFRTAELLKQKFSSNPRKLLTIAKNKNKIFYQSKIKEFLTLKDDKRRKYPFLFSNLRKIGSIFVTTNIDECFFPEFNEDDIHFGDNIDSSKIMPNKLFLLHGNINKPKSWIMTIDEYVQHYQNSNIKDFMDALFSSEYTLLFIGYGMSELEILDFVMEKFDNEKKSRLLRKIYVFQPFFKTDVKIAEMEQLYFDSIKTQMIPYSIDKKGYSQIDDVIEEWKKFMTKEISDEFMNNLKFIEENL